MTDDHDHDDGEHAHDDSHEHTHDGHSHDHGDEGSHDHPGTHDHHRHDREELGLGVLTVSSSRTLDDDPAGDRISDAAENAGHEVVTRDLVGDDYDSVQGTVQRFVDRDDVDVVVTTGGTGVTPDDVTIEAARPLFGKELPGFGELFRRRSYDEIGTMVVATRATAGVADGVPVFCLPGSENAAALGAELVVAAAGHLAGLASRGDGHDHGDGDGHDGHEHDHDGGNGHDDSDPGHSDEAGHDHGD